ncbi:hypothetical protein BC828DRAFT_409737, partial [Blastocladiella britannica]
MTQVLERFPLELVADVLAVAKPAACIAAASTELAQAAREPAPALAWTHYLLARSDDTIMDKPPAYFQQLPSVANMEYPDTRGLPTPATWLMKRLARKLFFAREDSHDFGGFSTPFSMHAVVDYILQPRRFRSIAHLSLDDVVREWHVLPVFRESTKTWTFPAPEPLTACLAAPRLRPVPEGLQLPGQYLLMGELDLFMATTRRLALLVPTLTSATAPIALWLRLGIDDRDA